jgi:hypothetical protein
MLLTTDTSGSQVTARDTPAAGKAGWRPPLAFGGIRAFRNPPAGAREPSRPRFRDGSRMDSVVKERRDPFRSTEGAFASRRLPFFLEKRGFTASNTSLPSRSPDFRGRSPDFLRRGPGGMPRSPRFAPHSPWGMRREEASLRRSLPFASRSLPSSGRSPSFARRPLSSEPRSLWGTRRGKRGTRRSPSLRSHERRGMERSPDFESHSPWGTGPGSGGMRSKTERTPPEREGTSHPLI